MLGGCSLVWETDTGISQSPKCVSNHRDHNRGTSPGKVTRGFLEAVTTEFREEGKQEPRGGS